MNLEVDVVVSRDRAIALQSGQQSKIPSEINKQPGVVVHAYNPSTLSDRGRQII